MKKYPKEIFVERKKDDEMEWLAASEEAILEQVNGEQKVAVYKFDRMVVVKNSTEIIG